jgi:hypothetical protein
MSTKQQIAALEKRIDKRTGKPEGVCIFHVCYEDDPDNPIHTFYHYADGRVEHELGAHGTPIAWLNHVMYEGLL